MRRSFFVLLIAGAWIGCQSQTVIVDELPTYDLHVGDTVTTPYDLVVSFKQVSQDSRCPDGVQCVWAGDATVHLEANPGQANSFSADLHTNSQGGATGVTINNYTFQLVSLTPYPKNGQPINPADYVATVRVIH
jgi:hypothetical protein